MIFNKLSEKDQKTIKVGALLMAIILACGSMNILLKEYSKMDKELSDARGILKSVTPKDDGKLTVKQAGLYKTVPVFKAPEKEAIPGENFQKMFMEQLKGLKIKYTVLNLMPMSNKENACGFKTRNIHCKGKCSFAQAVDLVAKLYENPWFVGIEEFKIDCNPKNRRQMDLAITVSTYIK
ncbi:MAG: hypothetical protein FVQ82_11580 [Planctomycetes bacterium]|nr:hypothetical protein [Planctomycetota bacterium]